MGEGSVEALPAALSNNDLLIGPLQGQSLATMLGEFPEQLIHLAEPGSLERV